MCYPTRFNKYKKLELKKLEALIVDMYLKAGFRQFYQVTLRLFYICNTNLKLCQTLLKQNLFHL